MALESTTNKVKYSCNGALTSFDFTFPISAEGDLEIIITTVATGVEQTLTLTTDYTVTASSNDFDNGGTVTTVATWSSAYTITIYRNVPLTQPSTFTENMTTLYQTFEDALNRLTMIAQHFDERIDSALKIKKSDTTATLELPIAADRASRYLAFDASGEPIASSGSPSSVVPVSSFMETLLDDTTATGARTTIDAQEETAASLAISALTPAANKIPHFTSASAATALEITANTFPARSSAGNIAAKTITDFALTLLDDSTAAAFKTTSLAAGDIVQIVNTNTGAVATGTTAIPGDDTIPQNTEGDEFMTLAITPTSATNKLIIDVVITLANSNAGMGLTAAIFQDTTANALCASRTIQPTAGGTVTIAFKHYMAAGTTSATTFKVRAGAGTGATTTINGSAGARLYGGVLISSITITEVQV